MLNAADWFRFGLGAGYRLVESAANSTRGSEGSPQVSVSSWGHPGGVSSTSAANELNKPHRDEVLRTSDYLFA